MPKGEFDAGKVDEHAGARLRARRKALGMSQETLGQKLGVSFQQVQKYERGANRISFSTLVRASMVLGVQIGYFAEGLDMAASADGKVAIDPATQFFAQDGAHDMAEAFVGLRPSTQRVVRDMVRGLAKAGPV